MKSYGNDLPNIPKGKIEKAHETAQQAVDVSKATLAATEEALQQAKANGVSIRGVRTMAAVNMVLLLTSVGLLAANLYFAVSPMIK